VSPRKNKRRAARLLVAVLLLLALAAAGAVLWLKSDWATAYGQFERGGVFVNIPHGSSTRAVARLLAANGVVRSAASFELLARRASPAKLQAGEYLFDRERTPREVLRMVAEGRIFLQSVTVPEGYTMLDIADLLARNGMASRDAFLDAARDPALVRDLAPQAPSLEGFLFPATYQFPRRTPPHRIAETMVRRFREAWAALPPAGAGEAKYSPLEIVTMASLVERETPRAAERPEVAGVFYNRLQRKIALDCDPTVIYALRLAGRYDGTLRHADLRFDSPYNTYQRRGLPPGPIANPGGASLRAALSPGESKNLYFVADAEGGHVFSRTLAEHNHNVALYRRRLAQQARSGGTTGQALKKQSP
jgi:UPF0755 protein